jgi:hypothetical protein
MSPTIEPPTNCYLLPIWSTPLLRWYSHYTSWTHRCTRIKPPANIILYGSHNMINITNAVPVFVLWVWTHHCTGSVDSHPDIEVQKYEDSQFTSVSVSPQHGVQWQHGHGKHNMKTADCRVFFQWPRPQAQDFLWDWVEQEYHIHESLMSDIYTRWDCKSQSTERTFQSFGNRITSHSRPEQVVERLAVTWQRATMDVQRDWNRTSHRY